MNSNNIEIEKKYSMTKDFNISSIELAAKKINQGSIINKIGTESQISMYYDTPEKNLFNSHESLRLKVITQKNNNLESTNVITIKIPYKKNEKHEYEKVVNPVSVDAIDIMFDNIDYILSYMSDLNDKTNKWLLEETLLKYITIYITREKYMLIINETQIEVSLDTCHYLNNIKNDQFNDYDIEFELKSNSSKDEFNKITQFIKNELNLNKIEGKFRRSMIKFKLNDTPVNNKIDINLYAPHFNCALIWKNIFYLETSTVYPIFGIYYFTLFKKLTLYKKIYYNIKKNKISKSLRLLFINKYNYSKIVNLSDINAILEIRMAGIQKAIKHALIKNECKAKILNNILIINNLFISYFNKQ